MLIFNEFHITIRWHMMVDKKCQLITLRVTSTKKRWWLIEGEREGTYCANDRLIVAFRNTTPSMFRLVGFVLYRRTFRTLLRLTLPTTMAVVTQKDILLSSQLFSYFRYQWLLYVTVVAFISVAFFKQFLSRKFERNWKVIDVPIKVDLPA